MTDRRAFSQMWETLAPNVRAYALRHVDSLDADDVVAETFLVAWRRWHLVPPDPLPWLLVTARNVVRNSRRGANRRDRLQASLHRLEQVARAAPAAEVVALDRQQVLVALSSLSEREREALLLTAWDGLSPQQAAKVCGCSVPAFNVRLHRARAHLIALTEAEPPSLQTQIVLRSSP